MSNAASQPGVPAGPVNLRLVYRTVALPSGRVGAVYGPRLLVQGGVAPYRLQLVEGRLPVGLMLSDDGTLGGTPTVPGTQRFLLQVQDSSTPPLVTQQVYALYVDSGKPKPAAKPASAASAAEPAASKPTLTRLAADDAATSVSRLGLNAVWVWKLSTEDLADLAALIAPPETSAPPGGASGADAQGADGTAGDTIDPPAPKAPPGPKTGGDEPKPVPTAEQLQDMLSPLVNLEYPTRALFDTALEARHCSYFKALMKEAAQKQKAAVQEDCNATGLLPASGASAPQAAPATAPAPAARTKTSASGPAKDSAKDSPQGLAAEPGLENLTPTQLYDKLLPAALKRQVIDKAMKRHELSQAQTVRWSGGGCGCVEATPGLRVQGIYPFWMAAPNPQVIDFSKFTRISYLAGLLDDQGNYVKTPTWKQEGLEFTRSAQQHGTHVDLMLYRRDWRAVLAMTPEEEARFVKQAAASATAMLNTRLTDTWSRLKPYLLPFWSEPVYLYDGITLFFDEVPSGEPEASRFRSFLTAFVKGLVAGMDDPDRLYTLGIVVPDQLLGQRSGPYDFSTLVSFVEMAERKDSAQRADAAKAQPGESFKYLGKTDVAVQYLVLMSDPTPTSRNTLRARLDDAKELQGDKAVAFLRRVTPVLLVHSAPPGAATADASAPAPAPTSAPADAASTPAGGADTKTSERAKELDADISYASWQFSAVGFWPVPVKGQAESAEKVSQSLDQHYFYESDGVLDTSLCLWVCPHRTLFRAVFTWLVVTLSLSLLAYAGSCHVRRMGRPYVLYLWLSVLATLLSGFSLLSCDPDLNSLRTGNAILYGVMAVLVAGGAYVSLKPRTVRP